MPTSTPPTAFESLAGVCKFIAVQKISPAFYSKHAHPIEFACAFLRQFASIHPAIEKALRTALPLTLAEGATPIQTAMQSSELDEKQVAWLDRQMTEVLRLLVPTVRDGDLPTWLTECKWAIEGAFEQHAP